MRRRHAVGDIARVIRESLRDVRGRVALGTVTAPAEFQQRSSRVVLELPDGPSDRHADTRC